MNSTPRFLQGVLAFEGKGLDQPALIGLPGYVVPAGVGGTVVIDLGLVEV